ncbi:hypothetical protein GDO86_016439 [Hymenochirus boettgeri]|uniref:Olfactory receptor n=1 Tax=Hymenochirus boettgeri TaxID=247094 RepID=A0A8T2JX40_9PIPI|nr:hypothetical protein GDO86_016439 [Hymenochirus boettgeri]
MDRNQSVNEFIIVGFSEITHYGEIFSLLFLLAYFIIITANVVVTFVIFYDQRLHTPMYYFIGTLSLIEICIISSVFPTFFPVVLLGETHISLLCCISQMYLFHSLIITENYLLNVMAFDRYIAIVHALRYHAIMTPRVCKILIVGCWLFGFLTPLILLTMVSLMTFCGPNKIRHLFCDSSPLLTLSCAMESYSVFTEFATTLLPTTITALFIVITYFQIFIIILKMKTREECRKAIRICVSHIIAAFLFYGSGAFMYIKLEMSSYSSSFDLATAIHHSVVTPLLSPLIYSLPSTEIKKAVRKQFLSKKIFKSNQHMNAIAK